MLHIITDNDTFKMNLLDPETGALVYPVEGVSNIQRIYLHSGAGNKSGTPYYHAHIWDRSIKDRKKAWSEELTDQDGKALLRRSSISIWHVGSDTEEPVLCVATPEDGPDGGRKVLSDLQGNALSIPFDDIESRSPFKKYVAVRRDEKINYLHYGTFRQMSPLWFEVSSTTHSLYAKHNAEPDFVACVRYKGRYRVLRTDGTLDPLKPNKTPAPCENTPS